MADQYEQPRLHRTVEAEEKVEKWESFDDGKEASAFATADADLTTAETRDRGLFGLSGKAEGVEKNGGDELEKETTLYDATDEAVGDETDGARDRGLFGNFMGKKKEEDEEKADEEATDFEKADVSEETKEEKKLQRSKSSSSISSSDEEEGREEGEKKTKKKKGLTEKIKEMVTGGGEKEGERPEFKALEKEVEPAYAEPAYEAEEQKGFMDETKENLPVLEQTRDAEDAPTAPPPTAEDTYTEEQEPKEKKGIFEKIKEKIPGYQTKTANN